MSTARRPYREVSVQAVPGENAYTVLLDANPLTTPAGRKFLLPTRALAEAVEQEWRDQEGKPRAQIGLLTKLCNTAFDRVRENRDVFIEQMLSFAGADLVCYRADAPADLVQRQGLAWNPLLQWLQDRYGVELWTVSEIAFVQQSPDALARLQSTIAERDDFTLVGLSATAALTGSLVIAVALIDGRLDVEEAFAAARVDEIYQEQRWGKDDEATAKSGAKRRELSEISRFIELLRQ